MEIQVCIPTLNAYDELERCIESIRNSTIKVASINVLDNGTGYLPTSYGDIYYMKSPSNLGVAGSWNWFIDNVPEIRLITNDDIIFAPDAIERMLSCYKEDRVIFPLGAEHTNAFSCFIIPQKIVDTVGKFDEWISPRYAYFEDNDYHRRMKFAGFDIEGCDASIRHSGSATLRNMTRVQKEKHHERFKLAKEHYIKKWGGEPGKEKYNSPFGR